MNEEKKIWLWFQQMESFTQTFNNGYPSLNFEGQLLGTIGSVHCLSTTTFYQTKSRILKRNEAGSGISKQLRKYILYMQMLLECWSIEMESSHWENHLFCHKMSLSLSISRYRKSRVWLYISNKNVADETGLWNIKLMINNISSCQATINRHMKKHKKKPCSSFNTY